MAKNPNLIVETPESRIIKVQNKDGTITARLVWKPGFGPKFTQQLQSGQAAFDLEIMKQMEPYMQLDTGMMIASMRTATEVGSGLIRVRTPYARRVYYSKAGIGRKTGALRGPRYFPRMKADKQPYLRTFARKVVGAKP